MGKKTYKVDLSVSGIEKLKKQLLDYKNKELPQKINLFVNRLSELGLTVAQTKVSESPLGKYVHVRVEASGLTRRIIATGEIKYSDGYAPFSTILAIEFGSGITYNPVSNPNADKFGFGVGTFPGQIHAFEDGWYFWDEKAQEWKYTKGVKATMPMYEAENAIRDNVTRIAKEVFR